MYVMVVWKTAEGNWEMNELKVAVKYNPGVIVFENFDEIKAA